MVHEITTSLVYKDIFSVADRGRLTTPGEQDQQLLVKIRMRM